jgi:pimeloyl-ACP methyl ester carboxylesterase
MRLRRKRWLAVAALAAAGVAVLALWPTLLTAALLLDLGGWTTFPRTILPARTTAIVSEHLTIPTRHGAIDARVDRPARGTTRTLVLLPGVHAAGLDEPRLTRFSTRVAAAGITVVTVLLPDLRAFRIVGRATDQAEDAAAWVATNTRLAPSRRVSLGGVSFAGGLALVAAGRPALAGRLDSAISLGGHGDLGEVLEYLCTSRLPDGSLRPAHEYGIAVVALAAVRHLVSAAEAPVLERALLLYLNASSDESPGRAHGLQQVEEARRLRDGMPERSRQIMTWVLDRNVTALGAAIHPYIAELASDPALSPERSRAATVPVFLLHGRDDNLIPPSETTRLAGYLEAYGNPHVRALVTPVLSHVGVNRDVSLGDWWRMVRFWRALDDAIQY